MENALVSEKDSESILIQCSCIGHCGYLELSKCGKLYTIELMTKYYSKYRKAKNLDKFNTEVNLTENEFIDFLKIFNNDVDFFLFKTSKKYSYTFVLSKINDTELYTLGIFKHTRKPKLIFDITLDNTQIDKLNKLYEQYSNV